MRGANKWQALVVAAGLAVSFTAGAEEPVTNPKEVAREPGAASDFGQAGQIVISSDASGFLGFNTGTDALSLRLEPAADYFFLPRISLGAAGIVQQTFEDGPNATALGVLFRAGYQIPTGEKVSLWPKLAFGPRFAHISGGGSDLAFVLDGSLPILFHVTPHFFLGGGPDVRILISDKGASVGSDVGNFYGNDVTIGLTTTVGGYF
jgi:hypothetical protein